MLEFLEKLARRRGKDLFAEDYNISNPYKWMLNQNEFDGLSKTAPVGLQSDEIHDPNGDAGLLVEWSVPADERYEVIQEVYNLLLADIPLPESDSDEITPDDLPTTVSNL